MPEMDGIQFLAALRENNNTVPVFVLTSDIQENKREQCLDLGAAGFLSKPLRKDELLDAFSRIPHQCKGGVNVRYSISA